MHRRNSKQSLSTSANLLPEYRGDMQWVSDRALLYEPTYGLGQY
jgi:hypothetical protein